MNRLFNIQAACLATCLGACLTAILHTDVQAQDTVENPADAAPLSAIDWLTPQSDTMDDKITVDNQVPLMPRGLDTPQITSQLLMSSTVDTVGVLTPAITGLPASLWAASRQDDILSLINNHDIESNLPALRRLFIVLMLAQADAPADATRDAPLYFARVDKLVSVGYLQQAQALLEAAPVDTPGVADRLLDVALLTGSETEVCREIYQNPQLSESYGARIFCTARNKDWNAALAMLDSGRAAELLSSDEAVMLERFLHETEPTELQNAAQSQGFGDRTTPLLFHLSEALAEPQNTALLPIAYAHSDLRHLAGWRDRIQAAERLARADAIDGAVLMALYTERKAAASGGVWDRVSAIQDLNAALQANAPDDVARTLPRARAVMLDAGLLPAFSRAYADRLSAVKLTGDAAHLAFLTTMLSPDYEAAATDYTTRTKSDAFLVSLARGRPETAALSARERAVAEGFISDTLPPDTAEFIKDGKIGEAILRAINNPDGNLRNDPRMITDVLRSLRAVGLEDYARRAALEYLITDPDYSFETKDSP